MQQNSFGGQSCRIVLEAQSCRIVLEAQSSRIVLEAQLHRIVSEAQSRRKVKSWILWIQIRKTVHTNYIHICIPKNNFFLKYLTKHMGIQ